MATTTPNFGWSVPTSTDLVKDGATAIETLGDAIDASLVDLKGGTTGQVLAKNSNTDMDFVWSNDAAGMTNPMTTTGDIIYSSSGSTPARLGIGTSGQVLNVAAGIPAWTTIAAGAYTSLATGSLSGATTTISSISGSYTDLYLIVVNPSITADSAGIAVRINSDATSNRHKVFPYDAISGSATFDGNRWPLISGMDNTATDGMLTLRLYNYANTTTWKIGEWRSVTNDSTTTTSVSKSTGFGVYNQIAAVTSIQFYDPDGGNLDGGTYTLYGVK